MTASRDLSYAGTKHVIIDLFSVLIKYKTIPPNISREYHVKKSCAEVDKAKGINSNLNSEFYCSQDKVDEPPQGFLFMHYS